MVSQRFLCHQRKFHDEVKNLVHDIPTVLNTFFHMLLYGHNFWWNMCQFACVGCIRSMKSATCPFHTGGLNSTLYCKQEWPLPDCGASPQKRSSCEPSDQSESCIVSAYWQVFKVLKCLSSSFWHLASFQRPHYMEVSSFCVVSWMYMFTLALQFGHCKFILIFAVSLNAWMQK